jgi:hypothetical protein
VVAVIFDLLDGLWNVSGVVDMILEFMVLYTEI